MTPELMMNLRHCRRIADLVAGKVGLDDFEDVCAAVEELDQPPPEPSAMYAAAAMRCTAKNARKVVQEIVDVALGRDAWMLAAGQVRGILARRLLGPIQNHGAEIIAALAEPWNEAADRFTEAARQLPATSHDFSPGRLVEMGSAVVALVEQTTAAAATMTSLAQERDWLADTLNVRNGTGDDDLATRYAVLTPNADVNDVTQQARQKHPIPWLALLRAPGVERLSWATLAEQYERLAVLRPPTPRPDAFSRTGPERRDPITA